MQRALELQPTAANKHTTPKSPVALKFIEASIANNEAVTARFMREAQSAAALRSTHVEQILVHFLADSCGVMPMAALSPRQRTLRVSAGDVDLHVVTLGSPERPAVVLVHGYPDNHHVWEQVARRLAEEHYVVLYDVRGAGKSDVPTRTSDYSLRALSADLEAVVDSVLPPAARFHLVGHDWGSIQSWASVARPPFKSRIASFTSISGPALDHAALWVQARASDVSPRSKLALLQQLASSLYIAFFHLPLLPAAAWRLSLSRNWSRYLERREGVAEPTPNPTQVADGIQGIQLYRANFKHKLKSPEAIRAECPVQLIVPLRDRYVREALLEDLPRYVPKLYRRDIDATHWVVLSHPAQIASWIAEFVDGIEAGRMSPALERAALAATVQTCETEA